MSSSSVPAGASFGGPLPYTPGSITTPQFNGFPLSMNLGTVALLGVDGLTSRAAFLTMQAALNTRGFANGLAGLDLNAKVPLTQIPTTLNPTALPYVTLTSTGSTGDISSMTAGNISGSTLPTPFISQIIAGQVPCLDMFSPARNGVVGDETLLNAILNGHNICVVKPGGPVTVKNSPIVVPTNAKLIGESGRQRINITRDVGYSGDTLTMGTPTVGCGSAFVGGLSFIHPGRFIPGGVPSDYVLQNRLTNDTAHIRAYGVQGAVIQDCFGWGMPHFVVHQGGSGLDIIRLMTIGGMYNPLIPAQQESISVFKSTYDPVHGYSVNCNITDPNLIGGNVAASTRSIPIDNKSYVVKNPRIGPQFGFLLQCFEVLKIRGGFAGGFGQSNFYVQGGGPALLPNGTDPNTGAQLYKPAWVLIRLEVDGLSIDESMYAAAEFVRTSDDAAICSTAQFHNCSWHGQLVQARGIEATAGGRYSLANLIVEGGIFAGYQGSCIRLYGVNGGEIKGTRFRGYNVAGFDTTKGDALGSGSAIYVADMTRGMTVGPAKFGGGVNYDTDPNNCQWGYSDITPATSGVSAQGNKYYGLDTVNMGITGGGPFIGGQKFNP